MIRRWIWLLLNRRSKTEDAVIRLIRQHGPQTVQQLVDRTGVKLERLHVILIRMEENDLLSSNGVMPAPGQDWRAARIYRLAY
jgi:hypothetical protein